MVQKNFILTDVMKTGNHLELEKFISFTALQGQHFDMTGEWYRLHEYDLNSYYRKIAFMDLRRDMQPTLDNRFFQEDLEKRCEWLTDNGFTLAIANPWESKLYDLNRCELPFDKKIIWTGDCSWFWHRMYDRYKSVELQFDHTNKKFDFLYLNKTSRPHRDLLFKKLSDRNILSNSLYSFHEKNIKLDVKYELPWVDRNNYPKYGHDRDIFEPQFNHSKFNIVSETIVHDETFLTEKIWKPIIAGQLFIVHGKYNYLEDLRSLGFETYGDFFDEGYDMIRSLEQRTDALVDLCMQLKFSQHSKLYLDSASIREHNQKIFFSEEHCRNACRKTLKKLLELVDGCEISSRESQSVD